MTDKKLIEKTEKQKWTFAKTYADRAPHEYFLQEQNPELFAELSKEIDQNGFDQEFSLDGHTDTYRCLYLGNHKYWYIDNVLNRELRRKMKILCVCNQGEYRSPTLARILEEKGHETRFRGIYNPKNLLTKEDLEWAELLYVLEPQQRKFISEEFPGEYLKLMIICLNVKDLYRKDQPELIEILNKKLND
ncbi:hypothetical protein ACFLQI_01580 [Candidatus Undinarchaeota archaeon]